MTDQNSHAMRRADHAITDPEALAALLRAALVGRVSVIANGEPYVVPMNFAYDEGAGAASPRILLHGASQGRLLEAITRSARVCFEVDEFVATLPNPVLCDYDTAFASVICYGQARVLESLGERTEALRVLARKYATLEEADALKERTVEAYRGQFGAHTAVIAITVEEMTGKRQPFTASARLQRPRPEGAPALASLGNVPDAYRHHDRVVSPGEPLALPGALLKWYELRPGESIVPLDFRRQARAFLREQAEAGALEVGYGLGFALLHYSTALAYLIVGAWRDHQELWETLFTYDLARGEGFRRARPGVDAPTLCVWELGVVDHERAAWIRYLRSARDDDAKQAYLDDRLVGAV